MDTIEKNEALEEHDIWNCRRREISFPHEEDSEKTITVVIRRIPLSRCPALDKADKAGDEVELVRLSLEKAERELYTAAEVEAILDLISPEHQNELIERCEQVNRPNLQGLRERQAKRDKKLLNAKGFDATKEFAAVLKETLGEYGLEKLPEDGDESTTPSSEPDTATESS